MANPTGKGGFKERPQDINREGAPKRGQSWQESIKRITDMTREEAIAFVGSKSKIGKLLKELPENLPIKDALVFISIIQYGRDPNPRLLAALMDREEGKPNQPLSGDPNAPLKVVIEYADNNNNPAEITPGADTDQE
jgi:hypothetical protein